jgi:glutaredoxin 3
MAKRLLDNKGLSYKEINVDKDMSLRQEMMAKTHRRTVPQIFIGDYHVGGFDELYALQKEGKLDILVAENKS